MPIKDSGKRQEFNSGMVRDVDDDKVDYTLALDGPMFERYAQHLTEGAKKYAKRNWMKAASGEERDRFIESAVRHFIQWLRGETDEDHAAAIFFNINGAEYVNDKLQGVSFPAEENPFLPEDIREQLEAEWGELARFRSEHPDQQREDDNQTYPVTAPYVNHSDTPIHESGKPL